jgi:hypothetical protein
MGQRPERPIVPRVVSDFTFGPGRVNFGMIDQRLVVGRAEVDPLGNRGDLVVFEFRRLGGHLRLFSVRDQFIEQAFSAFAGHDRCAALATLQQPRTRRDVEFGFGLFAAVAFDTARHEHAPHAALEQRQALGHVCGVIRMTQRFLTLRVRGIESRSRQQNP